MSSQLVDGISVAGFSKLFSTMWGGSLYGRFEASAVFMVVLSLCDKDGVIDMTPEAIAGTTGWPLDLIQRGLAELTSPDERSRTPDEDGRRMVQLDGRREWGWVIVNYSKYRDKMRSLDRRDYLAEAKRRERQRKRSTNVNTSTVVNQNQPIAEAEAEADLKAPNGAMSGKPDVAPLNNTKEAAGRVLEFLNAKAGRVYRSTDTNLGLIVARLKEGYDEDTCRAVIARKVREWQGDAKMAPYLRPATLFNREKFNQYAGECVE